MSIHQEFCKINLSKTDYKIQSYAKLLSKEEIDSKYLQNIYKQYCNYKKFTSVMPLFDVEFFDNDIIGYFFDEKMEAYSMIGLYDSENAECYQFAWTYHKPELELGIESLKHECAYYKNLGYKNYFLGPPANYKKSIDGYEVCGPL